MYLEELQSLCIQRNYSHCVFRGTTVIVYSEVSALLSLSDAAAVWEVPASREFPQGASVPEEVSAAAAGGLPGLGAGDPRHHRHHGGTALLHI